VDPIAQALVDDLTEDAELGREHAYQLVRFYMHVQKLRIAANNRAKALERSGRPSRTPVAVAERLFLLERSISQALGAWVRSHPAGQWMLRQHGVGSVLAAALLAQLLRGPIPERVSSWWAYAGLAPDRVHERGRPRTWNATLKVFCYRLADSFVRFHDDPKCYYGQVYAQRKVLEQERNERGEYQSVAKRTLETRDIRDPETRDWYEKGMLPPGRIELRARRYAVKLFLAHLHHICYEAAYGKPPPDPYPIPPPLLEEGR
jgi:hypothetical protein